jgi:hypothetical protein
MPLTTITESWASEDITDGELCFPGYEIYRVDRKVKSGNKKFKGGGVILYVKDSLVSAPIAILT